MVERLKSAIDKARAQRTGFPPAATPAMTATQATPQASAQASALKASPVPDLDLSDWSIFLDAPMDERRLEQERIVARSKKDPAHRAFDMLRTRTMRTLQEKGWSRIGLTSPTKGAGKTVVSLNLAFSLARQASTRVLLLDLDLVAPRLTQIIDPMTDADMGAFLSGRTPPEAYLRRCDDRLLVGLNRAPVPNSAELLQSGEAVRRIAELIERTRPTVVICDLSPIMVSDDALQVLANVDCALLVVAAGETLADEIVESEKLMAEWTPLLGIVLNKCDEKSRDLYGY